MLRVPTLQLVIRLAGRTFRPCVLGPTGDVTAVTPAIEAAQRVRQMIGNLAELPTDEASAALEALATDERLSSWRAELTWARDNQRVIRRDAIYRHPGVEEVGRTLNERVSRI